MDTANHALALRALEHSLRGTRFARSLLLTDALPPGLGVPAGIAVTRIESLATRDDYSRFVLKSLLRHVDTPHVLVIQWDGYVVNPQAFDPAFLDCDYIGAKWFWFDDAMARSGALPLPRASAARRSASARSNSPASRSITATFAIARS